MVFSFRLKGWPIQPMREKDRAKRRTGHGQHGRDAQQTEWSGPDIDPGDAAW
jgi:hypothetical protein